MRETYGTSDPRLSTHQETTSALAPQLLTVVDLLGWRARHQPDRHAYRYLLDDNGGARDLTYSDLDTQARAVAAWLQREGARGERVLLLYPSSVDFMIGFFGCLYAGAIAVPAYPPHSTRFLSRLEAIVADAQAAFALSTGPLLQKVRTGLEPLSNRAPLRWCATDQLSSAGAATWRETELGAETLALLQYTSGSTSSPKGVMVTHRNLMNNLEVIRQTFHGGSGEDISAFWLPMHHDMGLIGGVLSPLYVGALGVLMSPGAFLERPLRWLEAISRHRARITTAPNSAYQLCVDKSLPHERAALDLSSLQTAFCGAERIRSDTLDRFADAFAVAGFRREAFHPCYGLAEATLMVAGGSTPRTPLIHRVNSRALRENLALDTQPGDTASEAFVGCGRALENHTIVIVDPETLRRRSPDHVGEVWVSGPSVARSESVV